MNQITGNEPAYPFAWKPGNDDKGPVITAEQTGLTKREMFAMAAMQGLVSQHLPEGAEWTGAKYAGASVRLADALIAELNRTEP